MRISEETRKAIRAGYQKAARPRAYITEACEKYGLRRETVRKIIGLRTRDPTLEETQAASTGAADAAGSRKPAGRPRRMTKDIERQMVADLKAGMLLHDAAEKYGCCLTTAHHIRQRNLREIDPEGKGPLRGKRAFTPEQERQLAEDTQNGLSLTAAAAKYGCSEATVIRVRKRCGLARRR